jgi:hypothetical protein
MVIIAVVSARCFSSSSPYLTSDLHISCTHSLKSLNEKTIPVPEVKVSTSLHLFLSLVKNY